MNIAVILGLAAGTYAMRLVGPALRGRISIGKRAEQLLSIAATVLLGAFVATSAVFESGELAGWERFAGVAVGGVLAWRRAPFVLVVVAAAGTTALARLFVGGV